MWVTDKRIKEWIEKYAGCPSGRGKTTDERYWFALDLRDFRRLCAAKDAEITKLRKLAVYLYNAGYGQGHEDTVEGCYTDVLPVDADTYHADIVADILSDQLKYLDGGE